jgi:hypothetical protein
MTDNEKNEKLDIKEKVGDATEVVFCFDTTGSMSPCIAQVRDQIEATCEQMFEDIEGLKVGLIAHGDYCDGDNVITTLPLTDDQQAIFKFIREAPDTGGGDAPECYELALHVAQTMGWSDAPGKIIVMIGDATPHPPTYAENTQNLDWEVEAQKLADMDVQVFPLMCLSGSSFWPKLAEKFGTPLMKLGKFRESSEALLGAAYAASGDFDAYEARLSDKIAKGVVTCCSADMETRNSALRSTAKMYAEKRGKVEDKTDKPDVEC